MTSRLAVPLRPWVQRYGALIRTAWLVDVQYRAAIALWLLWGMLEPLVTLGIWWSIAEQGAVGGYAQNDFAQYFFGVVLINQLTVAWDAYYIDPWIRGGEMNFRLARPMAPMHEAIADNIAYKIRSVLVVVSAWLLIAIFWPAVRLPFDPGRWMLAALATALAAALRFVNGYALGLLAFWTTRATAFVSVQYGLSLFLSGRIAPMALLPPAIAGVAAVTWFPSMLAFPVDLLTGGVHGARAVATGFLMQLAWLFVWGVFCTTVWRRGIRRYAAVGG
jgi:ABC-2 type transport system permease protein